MISLTFLVLVSTAALIECHGDGAPPEACDTMLPLHGTYTPQPYASPFTVSASQTAVTPGDTITVTLQDPSGGTPFQGFLIKVVKSSDTTEVGAGTFDIATANVPAHTLNCSELAMNAVTHSNSDDKTSFTIHWTVPPESSDGDSYVILATVAETYEIYWVKFESETITVYPSTATTTAPTTDTTTAPPLKPGSQKK